MPKTKAARPKPSSEPAAPGFLTDRHLAEFGLTVETALAIMEDAHAVFDRIQRNPYATRDDLVKWWTGTRARALDDLNAAMDLLGQMRRIVEVP